MIVKGLNTEDFANYKKPSMFIIFPTCTFKCDKENCSALCQNSALVHEPDIEITKEEICEMYVNNPITKAFVFGGLEPFDSPLYLVPLIDCIRNKYEVEDDIVIYTGYTEEELKKPENSILYNQYSNILNYENIIIKFGRYIPNQLEHFDETLGIKLASPNQYALKIS